MYTHEPAKIQVSLVNIGVTDLSKECFKEANSNNLALII